MKSYKTIKLWAAAAMLALIATGMQAYVLPVKTVNGTLCYYYTVGKHETVYGVAHKLGVTRDDIIANNPWAADGLKNGQTLYFPASDFPGVFGNAPEAAVADTDESERDEVIKASDKLAQEAVGSVPADTASTVYEPEAGNANGAWDDDEDSGATVAADARRTVILIQPFMLNEEKETKAVSNITDFYRGFLLAADTLLNELPNVNLLVYDTRNDLSRLKNYLALETRLPDADIIIAPDNQEHFALIAQFAQEHQVPVLNPFLVRDVSYTVNPYLMQANIPSQKMYELAAKAYVEGLDGAVPVIIRNEAGTADKQPFVDVFVSELGKEGITPRYLSYSGTLHESDIAESLGEPDASTNFVFLPTSGSLTEFLKFSSGISSYKDTATAAGGTVKMYGYPEWVAFRNDSEDQLHNLDTRVYSRFFSDPHDFDTRNVLDSFYNWYGTSPVEGVPSQALFGYDLGRFVFENIALNRTFTGTHPAAVEGVQSTFSFVKDDEDDADAGVYNNGMFMIRFLPGGSYSKVTL